MSIEGKHHPLSGRMLAHLQRNYTQHRIENGTARQESASEPVLRPLIEKGIIKGFRESWNKLEDTAPWDTAKPYWPTRFTATCALGLLGTAEFFLIAAGIGIDTLDEEGNWKALSIISGSPESSKRQ